MPCCIIVADGSAVVFQQPARDHTDFLLGRTREGTRRLGRDARLIGFATLMIFNFGFSARCFFISWCSNTQRTIQAASSVSSVHERGSPHLLTSTQALLRNSNAGAFSNQSSIQKQLGGRVAGVRGRISFLPGSSGNYFLSRDRAPNGERLFESMVEYLGGNAEKVSAAILPAT